MKEKAFFHQESRHLQEKLAAINDKMTEIKDLEDKVMLIEDAENKNNPETTESPTNNLTFYHFVLTDKISTPPNYPVESNELLVSFESIQDYNFDLLALSQLADFPTKNFVGENLIEL